MKKTTGELLDLLQKERNLKHYMTAASDDFIRQVPLSDRLNALLTERGLKKSDIIHGAGLDRSYAYQIFDGQKTPNRDKVLALCLSMKVGCEETQQLLKQTGYPLLYARFKQDSIILFGLQHALSPMEVNDLLYEMKEPLLKLTEH
ncbi:MAG: hypothetical protein NC302_05920 [Bacteroidales bacterium]|nr:hypothetical protein [Bacteroidales bacterium]MCM1423976.1 hypothetical protein [bacterium]